VAAQNVRETLEDIVSGAIELTGSISGVIYLISEDGQSITKNYQSADSSNNPPPRLDRKEGLTFEIISKGKEIVVPNVQEDSRVNPGLGDKIKSTVGIPLKFDDKIIGILYQNTDQILYFLIKRWGGIN